MTAPSDRGGPPLRVLRTEAKCPVCARPLDPEPPNKYRPFCSKRCADIDLGRWLKESYRVPTDEGPDSDASMPDEGPGASRRPTGQGR